MKNLTVKTKGPVKTHQFVISPLRAALLGGVACATFVAYYLSPGGGAMITKLARPAQFRVRHWLGKDPVLDPRIRIYAFEDKTQAFVDHSDVKLMDWARVFQSFKESQPRAILVSKNFGNPRGSSPVHWTVPIL